MVLHANRMAQDRPTQPTELLPPSIPEIVQRYRNGESIPSLAKDCGKSRFTIYKWMLKDLGPDYHDLVTDCLIRRISDADDELETAKDMLNSTRAERIARFARLDFERRRPLLYGPKQHVQTDNRIEIHINRTPQPVVVQAPHSSPTAEVIDIPGSGINGSPGTMDQNGAKSK